jgi:hypothetical protein
MFYSVFFLLWGCTNPFEVAQQQNTIAAYEQFLQENPTHSNASLAKIKIENLILAKARESHKLEDYDAYLEKYKEKKQSENYVSAFSERMEIVWLETQKKDTPEVYDQFIKEYAYTQDTRVKTAEKYKKVAEYSKDIVMERIEKEQIDTSKSSSRNCTAAGTELNGWMFSTSFRNNTKRDIRYLRAKVHFLDENGSVLDSHSNDNTVIIGDLHGRAHATPKRRKGPFKIGEQRQWCYITGDIPSNWSKKVQIQLLDLVFMND